MSINEQDGQTYLTQTFYCSWQFINIKWQLWSYTIVLNRLNNLIYISDRLLEATNYYNSQFVNK